MSDEEGTATNFSEHVELTVFNVVIDYPGKIVPRIRVFSYIDDDDGVKVPHLLYEQTEEHDAASASNFARAWSPSKAHKSEIAALPVSEMALGVSAAATVVYEWATTYEERLGEPLFPTPQQFAEAVIAELMAEMCYISGVFYAGRVFDVTFSEPEEEYRPGIYL